MKTLAPGTAVLLERNGGVVPGVISRYQDGEYLIANVYWPTHEKPLGFGWAGWYSPARIISPRRLPTSPASGGGE